MMQTFYKTSSLLIIILIFTGGCKQVTPQTRPTDTPASRLVSSPTKITFDPSPIKTALLQPTVIQTIPPISSETSTKTSKPTASLTPTPNPTYIALINDFTVLGKTNPLQTSDLAGGIYELERSSARIFFRDEVQGKKTVFFDDQVLSAKRVYGIVENYLIVSAVESDTPFGMDLGDLYALPLDGSAPIFIGEETSYTPVVMPKGKHVLFTESFYSSEKTADGSSLPPRREISIWSPTNGKQPVSYPDYLTAVYSPNGNYIAFVMWNLEVEIYDVQTGIVITTDKNAHVIGTHEPISPVWNEQSNALAYSVWSIENESDNSGAPSMNVKILDLAGKIKVFGRMSNPIFHPTGLFLRADRIGEGEPEVVLIDLESGMVLDD